VTRFKQLVSISTLYKLWARCPVAMMVVALGCVGPQYGVAQSASPKPGVFDRPRLLAARSAVARATVALFARGEHAKAEKHLRAVLERMPDDAYTRYNLACALARQGKTDEALSALRKAVESGFGDPAHIARDGDLENLRDDPRFVQIVEAASERPVLPVTAEACGVEAARVANGIALVSEANVAWNPRVGLLQAFFAFDEDALSARPVARGLGKAGDLLRAWQAEGTVAGNHGDLYDNHDSDHSNMKTAAFPQLARVEFAETAKQRRLHHGAQRWFLYNAVTLGNSSTAVAAGLAWRSQARLLLTRARGAAVLYRQYRDNHLYVYPEHHDHDPPGDGKGHGDVFPANTPYMIISQGSSGSDKVFLNAVAATLAAFRPEVKTMLAKYGLLMPAVQMVFRMSNRTVETSQDYLAGKAHPTVFEGRNLDLEKMVTLAHGIRADALPPMVQIRVLEEDSAVVGRDYFDVGPRERLFDTPCAIGRVVKSTRYQRRMVVSAKTSSDPNGRPLTFHWAVLRGDADRIEVNRRNEAGSVAELLVPYHERRPVAAGSAVESSRVDIGVFVHNGVHYSAPAFVSFLYLDNERRIYDEEQRIRVVDYADPDRRKRYVDPLLDLPKDWRDEYHYDANGGLAGWTRIRGDARERFTADGRLVPMREGETPLATCAVRYRAAMGPKGPESLKQERLESGGQ
jgi:hypothetical protein